MKKHLTLFCVAFCAMSLQAEDIPANYYASADGKSDAELKTALYNIIRVGSRMTYGSGSWTVFYYSDRRADGSVWDMYSDEIRYFGSIGSAPSGMNVEHSFAKSWWGGSKNDAYKDCYHLNPSDANANSIRSNYPLGKVTNVTKTAGTIKVGTNPAYGSFNIWEPLDEYKGDFARAYFYMATCYENLTWRVDNKDVGSINAMQNDNYLEFQPWEQELLLEWHRQDPVSQKEIDRMAAVSDYQHNRNPYIDYPCLVEYIWGNKQGEKVDFSQLRLTLDDDWITLDDKTGCQCAYTEPTIISPSKTAEIYVGEANRNEQIYTTFSLRTAELTKNLTLSLAGDDNDLFTVTPTTVTAAEANNGVQVRVDYWPESFGDHVATLSIESSEVSREVQVLGSCAYSFKALPATNVYAGGFTAHWTDAEVSDYSLDVYHKTVTGGATVTVLDLQTLTADDISDDSRLSTSGKTYNETQKSALRLGTSSGTGSLIISGLNVGQQGKLMVKASQYNNDNSAVLTVAADGTTIEEISLESEVKEYTVAIPEGTSKIELIQKTNKQRVILYALRLTEGGTTTTIEHVTGYPRQTGDVTEYDVRMDLAEGEKVFYTVMPQGKAISNEVEVEGTGVDTGLEQMSRRERGLFVDGLQVTLLGVEAGEALQLYDGMGRLLLQQTIQADREVIRLPQRGFYLLCIAGEPMRIITE